jgi:hypothetical protein
MMENEGVPSRRLLERTTRLRSAAVVLAALSSTALLFAFSNAVSALVVGASAILFLVSSVLLDKRVVRLGGRSVLNMYADKNVGSGRRK